MDVELYGADALKYGVGMAPFVDDLMRITSPHVRRTVKRYRKPFIRKDEFYWLVRAAANHMLSVGLAVFTDNYKQAEQISRQGAIVSYQLTACSYDGETWMLKVEQENFNE